MKTKLWLYPTASAVPAAITALFCIFGLNYVPAYTVCYALVAGALSFVVARFIYHLAVCDKDVDFYCSEFFALLAVVFSFVFVTSQSMVVFKIFTGLFAFATICSVGITVRRKKGGAEGEQDTFSRLRKSLKFAFVGDNPNNSPDVSRPLCVIDGIPRSAVEAESLGYGAKAAEVDAYIRKIFK